MKKECIKCQYEWSSRTDNPVSCPRCKSIYWNGRPSDELLEKRKYVNPGSWAKARKEIMKRSGGLCENCKTTGKLVHHIDGFRHNHNAENLIMLCSKCHGDAHWQLNTAKKERLSVKLMKGEV